MGDAGKGETRGVGDAVLRFTDSPCHRVGDGRRGDTLRFILINQLVFDGVVY